MAKLNRRQIDVYRMEQHLDRLFQQARDMEDSLQSEWAVYLVILVSGYLERSIQAVLTDKVCERCPPEICRYIEHKLRSTQNLNPKKLADLLNAFSETWKAHFVTQLQDEQKAHLESLNDLRNKFAHGVSMGLNIGVQKPSLGSVQEYYRSTKEVVKHVTQLP